MDTAAMKHKIIVAGIGPGNPDYMVPMARQTIASAMALVGGRRALAQFAQPAGTGSRPWRSRGTFQRCWISSVRS